MTDHPHQYRRSLFGGADICGEQVISPYSDGAICGKVETHLIHNDPDPFGGPTAAADLAGMIHNRIPDWPMTARNGLWQWSHPDDEDDRRIAVDGRTRINPIHTAGDRGPLVVGHRGGVIVSVELPGMVDRHDLRDVLAVLEAADVLPSA